MEDSVSGHSDGPDLADRRANTDPGAFSRSVLAGGPVQWSDAQRGWLLLSWPAASKGFVDDRLSADRVRGYRRQVAKRGDWFEQTAELLSGFMAFRDDPEHARLREPVWRAFTPRVLQRLEPAVHEAVDELLDVLRATDGEPFDVKARFAHPLPAWIIGDLLGVPRSQREAFTAWSDDLGELLFQAESGKGDRARIERATEHFISFFGALIEQRRRDPGDDLISAVVHGTRRDDDELSDMELVGACTLLLFGGHETTTNFLTGALRTLLEHPAEAARFARGEVDDSAVDELMRLCSPAKSMVRKVTVGHELEGAALEPGQRVYLSILTANRDPQQFPDPDRLDLGRTPNTHLGFGRGAHLCLGANLARLESRIALKGLLAAFPRLAFSGEVCRWSGNAVGRHHRQLVLTTDGQPGSD